MAEKKKISSVLFVCLGNICRSPSAEAVFRHKIRQHNLFVEVDSAGTQGFHTGCAPDERSVQAGEARGYDFGGLKCRKVNEMDFEQFDLIIAMDDSNLKNLQRDSREEHHHKIKLFMEFSSFEDDVVPDPYYGGKKGFEYVLDLIEDAADGLIEHIKRS